MVALDATDSPVHDAILWNDTRSSQEALDLIDEMGGPGRLRRRCRQRARRVVHVDQAALAPRSRAGRRQRVRSECSSPTTTCPATSSAAANPFTDRGDASGTGYFSTRDNAWRPDLAEAAIGHAVELPRIVASSEVAGDVCPDSKVAAGTGDNMAAALALDLQPGDVVVSIGTSGVASAIANDPVSDPTGSVTGFADATSRFLPLVATINAARILELQCALLGVDHDELARLALAAPSGANGLTVLPYYDGERTPSRPDATGTWAGLTTSTTREDLARAAVEALLCSLADAIDHLSATTGTAPQRILLVGGAASNPAVRALAPAIFGRPVTVPAPGEYVALGAARQAAWALAGTPEPPAWAPVASETYRSRTDPSGA